MVGRLMRKSSDPNRKGRGAGLYYHRGNGVWSKYSEKRDAKLWHKRKKVKNVRQAEKNAPHKGDYKTKSKRSRSKTNRVGKSRVRGYF